MPMSPSPWKMARWRSSPSGHWISWPESWSLEGCHVRFRHPTMEQQFRDNTDSVESEEVSNNNLGQWTVIIYCDYRLSRKPANNIKPKMSINKIRLFCVCKFELFQTMVVKIWELPIEGLLPDECGCCKAGNSVSRVEKLILQCAGCQQGIHEDCLKDLQASATLSTLHVSLIWLCQTCTPYYCMMTVMGLGGVQSCPSNRGQIAVPSTPAPAVSQAASAGPTQDPTPGQDGWRGNRQEGFQD